MRKETTNIVGKLQDQNDNSNFYEEREPHRPNLKNHEERESWHSRAEYLLACIGYVVGLGNIWKFPHLVYSNGGGAFFIPYLTMLIFFGLPIFFLEISLGQFCSGGPSLCWQFAPLFRGIGFAMMCGHFVVLSYYCIIMSYITGYAIMSVSEELPWKKCRFKAKTNKCRILLEFCQDETQLSLEDCPHCFYNISLSNPPDICRNQSVLTSLTGTRLSGQEYFENEIAGFGIGDFHGIFDIGSLRCSLIITLVLVWLLMGFVISKGIKFIGKTSYVTSLAPYFCLVAFFFSAIWREGATEGIMFYLTPDMSKLGNFKVWKEAASQVFFSLSICMGGIIALSSFANFRNNVLKDTLLIVICNSVTSIGAGFVVFSYIGYMAVQQHVDVADLAQQGPALIFQIYPMALALLPGSQFLSVLFFLMLLSLGSNSLIIGVETIITSLTDLYPSLRHQKEKVAYAVCFALCLVGIPMCFDGGFHVMVFLDKHCGGWNLMIIGLFEMVALAWLYGSKRFLTDIECMIGKNKSAFCVPWRFWKYYFQTTWCFLGPLTALLMVIVDMNDMRSADNWQEQLVGTMLTNTSVCCIFGTMLYLFVRTKGSYRARLRKLTTPLPSWGPLKLCNRLLVKEYNPTFEEEISPIIRRSTITYSRNNIPIIYPRTPETDLCIYDTGDNPEISMEESTTISQRSHSTEIF